VDYTHGHGESVLASHGARTALNSCAYLLPRLTAGMSLLDVGCGPGTITLDLAQIVAPGRVVGVENVGAPLAVARANAKSKGDSRTTFRQGDAVALPFPDDSFDVAHAHQVLQHLADPVAALRELARVVRPGGLIAVRDVDYEAMTWYPASPRLGQWLSTYRSIARANGGEPDAGRHLRAWARAAGLVDVEVSASTWCYATEEATAWWGESQAQRVVDAAFASQALRQGLTRSDLDSIARAWQDWGASPDASFVMVHTEVLARLPT
jgi:ubiquinone/menaquinone biosynthesis C-methylase UbiE